MATFIQYLFSGLSNGAIYALSALGFTIVYNASHVINFAQGEFITLGGMVAATSLAAGLPLPVAALLALGAAALAGLALHRFALAPARAADPLGLIIVTIGASVFLQGMVAILLGKGQYRLPPFSGDEPIHIAGAAVAPQSLWMIGTAAVLVCAVTWFFRATLPGKAMRAVSINPQAAVLMGVRPDRVLAGAFGMAGLLGGAAGLVAAPITTTYFNVGVVLGLKGFVSATVGGLGSGAGAVAGGVMVGVLEALVAGYVSSAYKDAVPFVLIVAVLLVRPRGLFAGATGERS
jgi:branched-chain amino acid transport system permease protein